MEPTLEQELQQHFAAAATTDDGATPGSQGGEGSTAAAQGADTQGTGQNNNNSSQSQSSDQSQGNAGAGQAAGTAATGQDSGILKELFGDRFKSVDEVKAAKILEQLQEVETLRQRTTELEQQLSVKPKTAFANERIAKLNEFVRKNPTLDEHSFNQIQSFDPEKSTPIKALVLDYTLKNPKFRGREADVERMLIKKYEVDPDNQTPEEIEFNTLTVETDAEQAINRINELRNIQLPEQEDAEAATKAREALRTGWSPVVSKLMDAFDKVKVPSQDPNGAPIEFEVPAESRAKYAAQVLEYAAENNVPTTEQGLEMLRTYAQTLYVIDNYENHVRQAWIRSAEAKELELKGKHYNASGLKNNDKRDASSNGSLTADDYLSSAIDKNKARNGFY
jgi:hypothetical protein